MSRCFFFFNDIAGENAPYLMDNFNYDAFSCLVPFLTFIPYQNARNGHLTLEEIAKYFNERLQLSFAKIVTEARPDYLKFEVGELLPAKKVINFDFSPNLWESNFTVEFEADFQDDLIADLENIDKGLETPLDVFLIS